MKDLNRQNKTENSIMHNTVRLTRHACFLAQFTFGWNTSVTGLKIQRSKTNPCECPAKVTVEFLSNKEQKVFPKRQ